VPRATIRTAPVLESTPQPACIILTKSSTSLSAALTPDTDNSTSLIDLKSWETPAVTGSHTSLPTQEHSQIDLLFDIGENSLGFELSTAPIKQNESYCDLIGLQKSSSTSEPQPQRAAPFPKELLSLQGSDLTESRSSSSLASAVEFKDPLLHDMIGSLETLDAAPTAPKVTEILGLYSSVNMAKKNSFYENMTAINEVEEPAVEALFSAVEPDPDLQPSIDILITEPVNEMNDSCIVPEDMFDFGHEKPNERSSPSLKSRTPSPAVSISSLNNAADGSGRETSPPPPVQQQQQPQKTRVGGTVSPLIARSRPVVKAAIQVENLEAE
jgi:hypothetical protein